MGWKEPQTTVQSDKVSARPVGTPDLPDLRCPCRDVLCQAEVAWIYDLSPESHGALLSSGSREREAQPGVHATVTLKVWQFESAMFPEAGPLEGRGERS